MPITTDPNDPRLSHGGDTSPVSQSAAYLVLSEEERAKGFVRPVRVAYRHVGPQGPKYPLRDLTEDEKQRFGDGYAQYEEYPPSEAPKVGRFWTQAELDAVGKGCGAVTTMHKAIAETFATKPGYYGYTYCSGCEMHRPVGEFIWTTDGTVVGS